jgi:hypothetical protein
MPNKYNFYFINLSNKIENNNSKILLNENVFFSSN